MSANSEQNETSAEEKPDRQITLDQYYTDPKLSAGALLKAWAKNVPPALSADERRELLLKVKAVDGDYRRTLLLARKALSTSKQAAATAVMSWAQNVVAADRDGIVGPMSELPAEDAFGSIIQARLTPRPKRRSKADINFVLLALVSLHHLRQLSLVNAEVKLRETFGTSIESPTDIRRLGRQAIAFFSSRPTDLTSLLDLVRLWEIQLGLERSRVATLDSQVANSNARIAELESTEEQIRAELDELKKIYEKLCADLEAQRQLMQDQQQIAAHHGQDIRSRSVAFLNRLVQGQLAIVKEAASLVPPRSAVISEKIELALSAIEREVKWLESSG